jgi:hypothetical protein
MECYICYEKESSSDKFVKEPCKCKGSNKIHISCLKKLIEKNGSTCSICKQTFSLHRINDSQDSFNKYTYKPEMKYDSSQRRENYTFIEDNKNYRYEDKDSIINYTYVGNGTYRVNYKHKNTCVIS